MRIRIRMQSHYWRHNEISWNFHRLVVIHEGYLDFQSMALDNPGSPALTSNKSGQNNSLFTRLNILGWTVHLTIYI